MKVAHLDCWSGASGDMWLGALVGAGASIEAVEDAVLALGVGDVRLSFARVDRAGLRATAVRVHAPQGTPPVRDWATIRGLLEEASLDEDVRRPALAVFRRLAEAEGAVHGVPPETVRFHEIGALDTLADVVGACAGLRSLGIERLTCGTIAVGAGTVDTAHGTLPLPGPAVTELLRGFDVTAGPAAVELTTPTGAALIAELASPVAGLPTMRLDAVGLGAGGRDLAHPNVLRLFVGTADAGGAARPGGAAVVEATVDDLSPQLVPVVLDRLRTAGAHDAWATPVLMKKGRPGFTLTALCDRADVERMRAVLYRESTTIGSRAYPVEKEELERRWVTVEVAGHALRVKLAEQAGEVVSAEPEFEDVRLVAEATGRPARTVHDDAAAAARHELAPAPLPDETPEGMR